MDKTEAMNFLTDIAHEFQTPIAILAGNMEILERSDGVTPGEKKKALRVMRTTLSGMSRLANNLLHGARSNLPDFPGHIQRINVKKLLYEAYEDCLVLAMNKKIELRAFACKGFINADRKKIKEVILNLISNALRHTAPGGNIELGIIKSKNWVEISVADTGCGISFENTELIFERFYRIIGTDAHGTGLGLHICRKIIEAHQGSIRVESEPGKGSKFIVTLPRAP